MERCPARAWISVWRANRLWNKTYYAQKNNPNLGCFLMRIIPAPAD